VPVGGILAVIETEAGATVSPSPAVAAPAPQAASAPVAAAMPAETANLSAAITTKIESPAAGRFYSPLVLNIANQEGVSMQELENLPGTGNEGRVTKKDILQYVADKKAGKTTANAAPAVATAPAPAPVSSGAAPAASVTPVASVGGNMEIIEMDRMRRMIADNMIASKRTSAHVTSFVEADMTNVVMWRDKVKKEFEQRYGEKLTFTPIFIEAAVKAIQDFPMINVSVDGTNLIVKKDINIGMAAALPSGNLIVPVIHNADQYNLAGLAKRVNDLANRARINKLKPDESQGGTYTISNVGSFGNVMGTPIIPQPQVAIMAVGAIRKKPAVIETESGDLIGIRSMMFLLHSYDHRVVDGALGGMFVRRMADYLEQWDMNRPI
jgi:2-oxoglutarate dehydrogenase E2 component (dihydrolipoamide succinyltransferase)